MDKQTITGNGGASYTLTHAVANAQEIEVFVNNVRQEAGVAYTAAGTALTMTGNVASTDDFYVIYQGKALQTTVPPDGSVSGAKLATGAAATNLGSSINLSTIKDSTGNTTAMTIDSSGRVLTPARPAWSAYRTGGAAAQTTQNAYITCPWNATTINDGNFNTSTYAYTTPVAGLYHINYNMRIDQANSGIYIITNIAFDGSAAPYSQAYVIESNEGPHHSMTYSGIFELAANVAITNQVFVGNDTSWSFEDIGQFSGYLIG